MGKTIHKKRWPAGHRSAFPFTCTVRWRTWTRSSSSPSSYNLIVIEDACQAHGAEYFSKKQKRWLKAGSIGRAARFQFLSRKESGRLRRRRGGDHERRGDWRSKIRMLRDHGQAKKYYHDVEGYNGRLDAIQAGILRVKLQHLSDWNQKRREAASRYKELLSAVDELRLPLEPAWAKSIFHLYVVAAAERDELLEHLRSENIGHGIHYPVPVHLQRPYQSLGYQENDFPIAERACRNLLSLPMHPYLTSEQQTLVAQAITGFFSARRPSAVLSSAR